MQESSTGHDEDLRVGEVTRVVFEATQLNLQKWNLPDVSECRESVGRLTQSTFQSEPQISIALHTLPSTLNKDGIRDAAARNGRGLKAEGN